MEPKGPSAGQASERSITEQRLRKLLEAYGASPDRWPPEERAGALELLETSSEARAEHERAARLDALLDEAPAEQGSSGLAARVLAGATTERVGLVTRPALVRSAANGLRTQTSSRRARLWRYAAAAAPLAAAATLAFWLIRPLEPSPREPTQLTIAELGAYETPTDVLLELPVFDLVGTVPSLGCEDSTLGCPELDFSREIESGSNFIVGRVRV